MATAAMEAARAAYRKEPHMAVGEIVVFKDPPDEGDKTFVRVAVSQVKEFPGWARGKWANPKVPERLNHEDRWRKGDMVLQPDYNWEGVRIFGRIEKGKHPEDSEEELKWVVASWNYLVTTEYAFEQCFNMMVESFKERLFRHKRLCCSDGELAHSVGIPLEFMDPSGYNYREDRMLGERQHNVSASESESGQEPEDSPAKKRPPAAKSGDKASPAKRKRPPTPKKSPAKKSPAKTSGQGGAAGGAGGSGGSGGGGGEKRKAKESSSSSSGSSSSSSDDSSSDDEPTTKVAPAPKGAPASSSRELMPPPPPPGPKRSSRPASKDRGTTKAVPGSSTSRTPTSKSPSKTSDKDRGTTSNVRSTSRDRSESPERQSSSLDDVNLDDLGSRKEILLKLKSEDSQLLYKFLLRQDRQRKKEHREMKAEIVALSKTVGSLFDTQNKTLDHVEGIAADSSVGQRGLSGNPQEVAGLPWKTNRDMIQGVTNEEKRHSAIRYLAAQHLSEGQLVADFIKFTCSKKYLYWHIKPHNKQHGAGIVQAANWYLGKPCFEVHPECINLMIDVIRIQKGGADRYPHHEEKAHRKKWYNGYDNQHKKTAGTYLKCTILAWAELGVGSVAGEALDLLLFDHFKKTYLCHGDFPLDRHGEPTDEAAIETWYNKFLPIVAREWHSRGRKYINAAVPVDHASRFPNDFVTWGNKGVHHRFKKLKSGLPQVYGDEFVKTIKASLTRARDKINEEMIRLELLDDTDDTVEEDVYHGVEGPKKKDKE